MKLNELNIGDILYNAILNMTVIVRKVYPGIIWYQMRFNGKYNSSISNIDGHGIKHWKRWSGV